jgi:hypothetical protein
MTVLVSKNDLNIACETYLKDFYTRNLDRYLDTSYYVKTSSFFWIFQDHLSQKSIFLSNNNYWLGRRRQI